MVLLAVTSPIQVNTSVGVKGQTRADSCQRHAPTMPFFRLESQAT
jgi:hypothetical protein